MTNESAGVVLRRYMAETYRLALDAYEADLRPMADKGWFPVAHTWGWDAAGSAGWFVGGSHWKPGPGVLAVTFRLDERSRS